MEHEGSRTVNALSEIRDRLLRSAARAWARSLDDWALDSTVSGESPHVHSRGPVGHRVLLLGSGIAVGWGVQTPGLALSGALARGLTSLTGVGTDVDVNSSPRMSAAEVTLALADHPLERFDLIVLSLGVPEAMCLMAPSTWRHELTSLLRNTVAMAHPNTVIALLGVADIRSIPHHDSVLADRAHRRGKAFDLISREVVEQMDRVRFVPTDGVVLARGGPPSGVYAAWGASIAAELADELTLVGAAQPPLPTPETAEEYRVLAERAEARRQAAVDALTPVVTDRMTRLVKLTRSAFGTDVALLTVIDGDTQHHRIRVGLDDESYPRSAAFCSQTIFGRGELVVGDATVDPRFAGSPLVSGAPFVRFYAGFPIESPSGERIGALCVIHPEPREVEDFDARLLRELALAVQAEIWAVSTADGAASDRANSPTPTIS